MSNNQALGNVTGFALVTKDGRTLPIESDVWTQHSTEIHAGLKTASESELQELLNQVNIGDYFSDEGSYKGPDCYGLGLRFEGAK